MIDPTQFPEPKAALEWYNANSLRVMLRYRRPDRRDLKAKAEVLAALQEAILDPSSIQVAVATCDPIALEALVHLKRRGGVASVAGVSGQIAVRHPNLRGKVVREVPSELVRRGLAFWQISFPHYESTLHDAMRPASQNPFSARIYSPAEILDQIPLGPVPHQSLPHREPVESPPSPLQWQRRILDFLRVVETRQPKLLQSGAIGARDRDALGQASGLTATVTSAPRLSPVACLVNAFRTGGLVEVSTERQLRTSPATLRFASLSPVRQADALMNAWIDAGENELLTLGHIRCERRSGLPKAMPEGGQLPRAHRFLVDFLRTQLVPGYWHDVSDVVRAIRQEDVEFLVTWVDPTPYSYFFYSSYQDPDRVQFPNYPGISLEDSRGRSRSLVLGNDWDLVEGAFIRAVLNGPLRWLGIVECRTGGSGIEQCALTPLGTQVLNVEDGTAALDVEAIPSRANALIVQPNFDVIVYEPEHRGELLYQIDRFGERVSLDRLAIYRLTEEALCNGLQLGLRIDDVFELLESASQTPLPQNVVFTLRDWARRFEEVRVTRNAWLLEAPDAGTLDEWLADSQLASALERRITPTVALFASQRPNELVDLIAARGTMVYQVNANDPYGSGAAVEPPTTLRLPTAEANVYLRAALSDFADLLDEDSQRVRYGISPETVGRALQEHWDADKILRVLQSILSPPLPAGLRVRIKGWAGVYAPVQVGMVGILLTDRQETLAELRADPELRSLFIASVSGSAALVPLDALDVLRQALVERQISTTPYAPPAGKPRTTQSPPTGASMDHLSSHETRDALETAIANGQSVTLMYRDDDGEDLSTYHFEPHAIESAMGDYVVHGFLPNTQEYRDLKLRNIVSLAAPSRQHLP